ncbi:phosphate ABC transporter substrate-binding protein PstS [Mycobacterium sp.]|uniref:phosphate ABC transporter substrate-binding protein PstS n=1 Tax=Mycobacterium sp. TaxID=1785 RepID=UPI003C773309
MKLLSRTTLALSATALLVLAAAACGSNSKGGSSNSGAPAGSPATTPATSQVPLSETGSTLLYPLFNQWGPAYHTMYSNVTITTGSTGSGAGISQAAAGAVTIGASDAYLSEADMAAHKGLMNIALAISAEQINYNLPSISEHLKLNGKVLAAMYQGTIKAWNDPQIAALNPGVNLPATPVVPLHRSDGAGDTFLFTQYLSKQDPGGWGKSPGFSTTVAFPAVPGALGENGNGGMVTGCAETLGCVAYIGISYIDQANEKGLGEVQLGNSAGNFLLPDGNSMQAAAASFTSTPANQAISLVNGSAPDGYPIINYEYAIVYNHQKDAATAQTLQAFLHWAVTDGNDGSYLAQVHFRPLPPAVVKLSDAQIATISG